ncbi:MAG: hypothetical protein Q9220_005678 [cf. Caloplaca sp. 1 TL-2023]
MVSGPEDDFSSFLEFGDVQLNFPPYDSNPQNGEGIQDGGGLAMDMQTGSDSGAVLGFQHDEMNQFAGPGSMAEFDNTSQVFPDLNIPSHLYGSQPLNMASQPPYGQSYSRLQMVPPTPNSMEMHGAQAHYQQAASANHARPLYEQYGRQLRGQGTFTPLVSPAVTPHDAHFRYSDYGIAGDCFSPLTSPALEAQNTSAQRSAYSAVRGSDTSDTTSPVDMNIDPSLQQLPTSTRRTGRRASSNAQRDPCRSVRQSPSMKPQSKKKQASNTSIPPKRVAGIIEDAENAKHANSTGQRSGGKFPMTLTHDSSEAESISPEPLSEVLMPPPATPKSTSSSKSPQIVALNQGSQSAPLAPIDNQPATPMSLMRISKAAGRPAGSALKEQTSLLESQLEQTMEAIAAPETAKSSAKRPALTPLRTSDANDDEATPTMAARKTPRFGPTSAPVTATNSVFPSPSLNGLASPNGILPNKRGDARLGGRGGKKRTNSSSVQVSPALRPRISPSIKPLLPDGGVVSAEASTLLLASKSNYQNLVEGTHLPGVSYPENLSTNLTSKRTSHKIAEQGRRNRINTALQEIASLLPRDQVTTPKDGIMMNGNGNGRVVVAGAAAASSPTGSAGAGAGMMMTQGTAAQQSNSKASTVESAIDYIKALQEELRDVRQQLEVARSRRHNDGGAGAGEQEASINGSATETAIVNGSENEN